MYEQTFQKLGLSKNESRILDSLFHGGELSITQISEASHVHRRNVYDSLNRLIDKGLIFEIIQRNENRYMAIDPNKLLELLDLQKQELLRKMPEFDALISQSKETREIFVYRGIEGWKRSRRDILRVGDDVCRLACKAEHYDSAVNGFVNNFLHELQSRRLKQRILYDHATRPIVEKEQEKFAMMRFLPKNYDTSASIDIFGDEVHILNPITRPRVLDHDLTITVVRNHLVAEGFRTWFQFLWDECSEK